MTGGRCGGDEARPRHRSSRRWRLRLSKAVRNFSRDQRHRHHRGALVHGETASKGDGVRQARAFRPRATRAQSSHDHPPPFPSLSGLSLLASRASFAIEPFQRAGAARLQLSLACVFLPPVL
jgi:hypothetical protein